MGTVFKTSLFILNTERHLGWLKFYPQPVHHFAEIGIGPSVKDNETCVYRIMIIVSLHVDGMCMPPDIISGLKNPYIMFIMQKIGCSHT